MDTDFSKRLFLYKSTIAIVKIMLADGIISEDEYAIIDTIMLKKYELSSCSIFR